MAKRRSKEQLKADKIIKAELLKLKERILAVAEPLSRRDKGRLQDEMNGYVKPDTKLTMYQMHYGAYNYPNNSSKKRNYVNGKLVIDEDMNVLLHTILEMEPETTKIIIGEINDVLLAPFKKK